MAVDKPIVDNAQNGAIRKPSQTKATIGGAAGYTKRDRSTGEFMVVEKPTNSAKAAKKSKGVRVEKKFQRKRKGRDETKHGLD